MIDRYRIAVSKQTSFSTILDKVIIAYSSQPHRTIKTKPNEMYNDIDKQKFNFEKDKNIIERHWIKKIFILLLKLKYKKQKIN